MLPKYDTFFRYFLSEYAALNETRNIDLCILYSQKNYSLFKKQDVNLQKIRKKVVFYPMYHTRVYPHRNRTEFDIWLFHLILR